LYCSNSSSSLTGKDKENEAMQANKADKLIFGIIESCNRKITETSEKKESSYYKLCTIFHQSISSY